MKWVNTKWKKVLVISTSAALVLIILIILFISPLTKYFIEKYDQQFTGREIKLNWAYINPFTGYIYLNGLKLYEHHSDSLFFSADGIGVDIELFKLLSGTFEISRLTLDRPRGIVIQNRNLFNFDDLIKKFVPENSDTTGGPAHVNILNIAINDGEFHYRESDIPVNYFIKKVNIASTGMQWNVDTLVTKFSFLSGPGSGEIKGQSTINLDNMDFRLAVIVKHFDLKPMEQYVREMSKYGTLRAFLDADIHAAGNITNKENLNSRGKIEISDFHFGKNEQEDYASFKRLAIGIHELSPIRHIYEYDSISLDKPYFKYEKYDQLDNLQNMFGKGGSNIKEEAADKKQFNLVIEIAEYIRVLARNFFRSEYKVNRAAIYNADLRYNDYSISEKFSAGLSPFSFIADSINKKKDRVYVKLSSGIKPHGNMNATISINPKDSSDFDLAYNFEKIPISMFNPYTVTYTSYTLDRGSIELKGNWHVRNGHIKSENHFLVLDPRSSKRIRNKDTRWIPMPLIMSLVRERGNVIDYEIPITGDLKDPNFKLHDVILDLLANIFVKPPTTPYRAEVKNVETEIEKFLSFKWAMRQDRPTDTQEKFIRKMADFLEETPEALVQIQPLTYAQKEKEYITFFEAKKKYFLHLHPGSASHFTSDDSSWVDRLSAKDQKFVKYLDQAVKDTMVFTIQEKCTRLLGEKYIQTKLEELEQKRKKNFSSYFSENNIVSRVKFTERSNSIPFNGFSYYKIQYNGIFPESLLDAYTKISELNEEPPRKEYKKERLKKKKEEPQSGPLVTKDP